MTDLKGSTTPRIWSKPLIEGPPGGCGCGCALTPETSRGFEAVEFASTVLGIDLIPWQRWLFIHAFELRPDYAQAVTPTYNRKLYRYRIILILISRQQGKTTWVDIKNLYKMFMTDVQMIIGTAQVLDVAEASWEKGLGIIEAIPELSAELSQVYKGNGKRMLKLASGAVWKPVAANRAGGRGATGDDVNLDELREHLHDGPWAAVTKTTLAINNAQIWAYSNAGDDRSVVLNRVQEDARKNAEQLFDESLGIFEWSAPDHIRCTCAGQRPHADYCLLRDPEALAQANPSLGYTVTLRALISALNTDPEAVFRTECLCQRVPELKPTWQIVTEEQWTSRRMPARRPEDVVFAVRVSYDRDVTTIAACGMVGERRLVTLVEHRKGTHWVPERLKQLRKEWDPALVVLEDRGPSATLYEMLPDRDDPDNVEMPEEDTWHRPRDRENPERGDLVTPWADDVARAHGLFLDAVLQSTGDLWHTDDGPVNVALAHAEMRPLGGGRTWQDKGEHDAGPLQAVTLAYWAHVTMADKVSAIKDEIGVW